MWTDVGAGSGSRTVASVILFSVSDHGWDPDADCLALQTQNRSQVKERWLHACVVFWRVQSSRPDQLTRQADVQLFSPFLNPKSAYFYLCVTGLPSTTRFAICSVTSDVTIYRTLPSPPPTSSSPQNPNICSFSFTTKESLRKKTSFKFMIVD